MNPATALARAVLGELVHQGVHEVVLAPGSRSAPLAFEALRLADAGTVRLHVRIDERSAGFLALGLAKVSGQPVAVICTSGTAVANLAPAVVEASYSAVPLVVVSADRPVESRGVGSPQTIDQVQFFAGNVRFFADLGAERATGAQAQAALAQSARATVGLAVAAAQGVVAQGVVGGSGAAGVGGGSLGLAHAGPAHQVIHRGPVHLNVGLRPPLVPEPAELAVAGEGAEGALGLGSPPRIRLPPLAGCDHREAGEVLGGVPARGVILAGDLPCSALRGPHQWLVELASACGWPIIAEPSANLHDAPTALGHGVLVLGAEGFLSGHLPDLVLTVGNFGLSRSTMQLVRRARRHVAIELPTVGREVCDPVRTADLVLAGIPLPPSDPEPDPVWLSDWRAADSEAARVVAAAVLAGTSTTGSAVAAHVWRSAPDDALLLVAASLPVRQVEAFAGRRTGLRVIGNRGANGIDGLVSTAWGAALAHQAHEGGPALALLGDLALLHDHNGLLVGADEPRPDLVIVVIDNDGGGIFHQLEQGRREYADSFERIFGTPHGRDLVAVAAAAGVPAVGVTDLAGLDREVRQAQAAGGVHVVVVRVPDRAGEADLLARVRGEVARLL
jgi:2-succinyl-5-enolpyruvyl-6-hydroxy-3-cyclohexene-1-carboxylate synthase